MYGCVKFEVTFSVPENVINSFMFVIPLKNIVKINENTISFCVYYKYKDFVKDKLNNKKIEWKVIKETGLPFIMSKIKKRPGMISGLILSIFFIFLSTMKIWDIRVVGNTYVSENDIKRTLSEIGIAQGKNKDKKNLERMYNEFLLKENRISWISVNFDGTVAYVEVDEREIIPEKIDENAVINIIAKSDGVIKRVDVLRGKSEVFPGETVEKGQLLISSFITSDITKGYVKRARGFAWAQTEKCYDIYIKKNTEIKKIKREKRYDYLNISGITIPLFLVKNKANEVYETEYSANNIFLFDEYKLPFYITSEKRIFYKWENVNVEKEEAFRIAESKLEGLISDNESKVTVLNKAYTFSENEEWYIYKYNILCIEDIGKEIVAEFN